METNTGSNYGRGVLDGGLRTVAVIAVGLLALFLLAKSINEFKTYSVIGRDVANNNTITVSGTGEAVDIPDIATFSYSVTSESMSIAEAQDQSTKATKAIGDFLSKNGVAEKDIKTIGYNLYPRYEYQGATYYNQGKRVLAGYVVTQTNEVKVRKLADAGKLIGGLGELGATDVSNVNFTFDDEEKLKTRARNSAVSQAKTNAEDIARSLGVTLGRVVNFSESTGGWPMPFSYRAANQDMKLETGGAAPEITPGENKVTTNVTITYELK